MQKFFENRSAKFWLIIVILITIPTFYQLLRPGYYFMQDDLQAFRTQQMFKCFLDLQIPCRWIPDMGYQYGYPQFLFYPPSVYYMGAFIHLFGIQIIDSVKILFIAGLILSTVFMYIFLKAFFETEAKEKNFFTTTLPAIVGAVFYTYAPYKSLEVFVRGALNEFWSLVFFPLIFWAVYQLITKKKIKYLIFLSLVWGGLMLTHNLMVLIFTPLLLIWILLLIVLKKEWRMLPKVFIGLLLGSGMAAFFTLPIIFESKYAHLESMVGGYFDYRAHFVSLYRLFISNIYGYGSSGLGQDNNLTVSAGQIQSLVAAVGFFLALVFYKKNKIIATLAIILTLAEAMVLFMIHQKSSFIWSMFPFLVYMQFPWRFLTDSVFLLSILGALATYFIATINIKYVKIFSILVCISVFILHAQFFQPRDWFNITDADKFSGKLWEKELTISIFDYLPIYARFPPVHKAPDLPEVLKGKVIFSNYKKGSNYQFGEISSTESATLRLPLFDFPGMEVTVDGKIVAHDHNDCTGEDFCLGLITFDVSAGTHLIKAQLKDTPIRTAGNIISIISFFSIGILVFLNQKNGKTSS